MNKSNRWNNIGPIQKVGRVAGAAAVCTLIAPIALFNSIRFCCDTQEEHDARKKKTHNSAVMLCMTSDDVAECVDILYAEGVELSFTGEDAEANADKIVAVFERD